MSYRNTAYTTCTKSIYTQSKSQQKNRTQSQQDKLPLQNQKLSNALQTPPPHHNLSKSSTFSKQSVIEGKQKTSNQSIQQMQKLDNQFVKTLTDLENYYTHLTKHEQIRVERWIVKIIENDETIRWKQNRNNYLKLLHHIVKQNGTLAEPFDKMPDMSKDLPYLSDHDFNQKTKPRFDGKSPIFHVQKPEMIKIDEPIGDNFSVLMSIINTARTQMSKQNNAQLRNLDFNAFSYEIKQSQLIEVQPHSFGVHQNQKEANQYENEEEIEIPKTAIQKICQMQVSSVIPSNLPSQVKSFCNGLKSNTEQAKSKDKNSKYKNHEKYSNTNSVMQSRNIKQSLNSSFLQFGNRSSIATNQQLKVYKELVLAMGKLLLKHEFVIQKESQYWQLLRMIYSYQTSLKNSLMTTPQRSAKKQYGNSSNSDRVVEEPESFEIFLSRLRQEVEQNNPSNSGNLSLSPQLIYTQDASDPRQLSFSGRQSFIQQHHQFIQTNPRQKITPIYNELETVNHITEQSLDFKVQEGAEPSHLLYYELNQKPKSSIPNNSPFESCREEKFLTSPQYNNSLMQISDSYREIRRKNSPNDDYHNIYNELEAVEDEEICFTKERFIDGETDRMYYKNSLQFGKNHVKDFDNSPQFTDRQENEEDQFLDVEDGYYQDEGQIELHQEEENLIFSNSSNNPPN